MPRAPVFVVILSIAIAGCSKPPASPFPETITYGSRMLTKATSWNRGGIAGIVYAAPGEQLPSARLQVGVIVSTEHISAALLHSWVQQQFNQSGALTVHQSGTNEESCKAVHDNQRSFVALDVCKTGVARAACVEADEELDPSTITACLNHVGCFDDVCDRRWSEHREALDLLAADVLSTR